MPARRQPRSPPPATGVMARAVLGVAAALLAAGAAAQAEGGLYIAGAGFSFQVAAERGLSQNPGGRRFFVLSLPPETTALLASASAPLAALRNRVAAGNGVLLVCQRDIDNGRVNASALAPGVVPVRGWPATGGSELPAGQRYLPGENPADLPAANEALRQLRSTCS
jgi:hypothetical protein